MSFLVLTKKVLSCTNILNLQLREVNIMNQEAIEKATKVINQCINFYQKKLTYQLELKSEAKFNNGNLKNPDFSDYESNIEKYEIILSDLSAIVRALNSKKTSVKIFGTAQNRNQLYVETANILIASGFNPYNISIGNSAYLLSIEGLESEISQNPSEKSSESFDDVKQIETQFNQFLTAFYEDIYD